MSCFFSHFSDTSKYVYFDILDIWTQAFSNQTTYHPPRQIDVLILTRIGDRYKVIKANYRAFNEKSISFLITIRSNSFY